MKDLVWEQWMRRTPLKYIIFIFERLKIWTPVQFFIEGLMQGRVATRSAAISFRLFAATFPVILMLLSLLPVVPIENFQLLLFESIRGFFPGDTFSLFESTVEDLLLNGAHSEVLSIGFVLSLFYASSSINAILLGLNEGFHVQRRVHWLWIRLVAVLLMVVLSLGVILAVGLIVFSGTALDWLAAQQIVDVASLPLLQLARWGITLLLVYGCVTTLYNVADFSRKKWQWRSAGAVMSTALFVLTSMAFAWFVASFASYNRLYGSLGTLLVLLIWLNANSMILLLGFELNTSLQSSRQARSSSSAPSSKGVNVSKAARAVALLLAFGLAGASQSTLLYAQTCKQVEVTAEMVTGSWASEVTWLIVDESANVVAGPFGPYTDNYTSYTEQLCMAPGCYIVWMFDSYGDGWQGGVLTMFDVGGEAMASGFLDSPPGAQDSFYFSLSDDCDYPGCTNPDAMNFNPSAGLDDGSCTRQSDNVNLYAQWTDESLPITGFGGSFNDVEGLFLNGREYAIIGSTMGTHVIDVTDPGDAPEVYFLPGAYSGSGVTHRDYHFDGTVLYAVCDQGTSSLQIFDLSGLPASVTTLYDDDELVVTAHNVFVDNASDLLYLCNMNRPGLSTPLMVLNVANPSAPSQMFDLAPWVSVCHDVYAENDTVWVNAMGGGLIVIRMQDGPVVIGTLEDYPEQGANHSGWWVPEDEVYVFADETHGAPLKVVDTSDLTDLQVVSMLSSGTAENAIAHNLMIRDERVYVSYYHDGLQVFDIHDPENPHLIAWFDTYPPDNHSGYAGAWGVHAALPSGRVLISDIQRGLFVLDLEVQWLEVCPEDLEDVANPLLWNGVPVTEAGPMVVDVPDETWGVDIAWAEVVVHSDFCVECLGDFDGDNVVSISDLMAMLGAFGCTSNCSMDLNGDGAMNVADLIVWLGLFGSSC